MSVFSPNLQIFTFKFMLDIFAMPITFCSARQFCVHKQLFYQDVCVFLAYFHYMLTKKTISFEWRIEVGQIVLVFI